MQRSRGCRIESSWSAESQYSGHEREKLRIRGNRQNLCSKKYILSLLLLPLLTSGEAYKNFSAVTVEVTPNMRQLAAFDSLNESETLIFAVIPKAIDNEFFKPVKAGCEDQARRLQEDIGRRVVCNFTGPENSDGDIATRQKEILLEQLENPQVVGISISVENPAVLNETLQMALEKYPNTPIVTFDSDMPDYYIHLRRAYIGTNNTFLGEELARAVLQLQPNVETYGLLYSGDAHNIQERRKGFTTELEERKPGLNRIEADAKDNVTTAIALLDRFAEQGTNAIVSLMGVPMRTANSTTEYRPWRDMHERHKDKDIKFVCGDAMDHQLGFLTSGYVHGLIGQLPYEMGAKSIISLYDLVNATWMTAMENRDTEEPTAAEEEEDDYQPTNVVSHIFVPLELPHHNVDGNLIGNLSSVGYSLFGIILLTGVALLHWTFNYRNVRVVQVAQPKFLAMIIFGVIVMAFCLVPLSMDDGGDPDSLEHHQAVWICMSVPWLASIGFTTVFSALYAKTRRINKIFHSNSAFARVRVSETEVLLPFSILLLCNLVVLTAWTYFDPLTYTREDVLGDDGWNRVLYTYGGCRSDRVERFIIPMACLDMGVLVLANWQAFEARHIEAEFSETRYITICMASMLQSAMSGIPVLFVVKDNPEAFYLIMIFMIFIIGMVILLVIFVPKIMFTQHFLSKTAREQRDIISLIIQQSSKQRSRRWGSDRQGQENALGPHLNTRTRATSGGSRWTRIAQSLQGTAGASQQGIVPPVSSGTSPYGTTQFGPSAASGVSDFSDDRGSHTPSHQVTRNTSPAEPLGQIAEHSREGEHRTSDNDGVSFTVGGLNFKPGSTSTLKHESNSSGGQRSTGTSLFNPSFHGTSLHSFYSSSPGQNRNLSGLSSHHHASMVLGEGDDPSQGMLVFRTMSIAADGSLAPSSYHYSRFIEDQSDNDDAVSFYSHTAHAPSSHTLTTGLSARTMNNGMISGDSSNAIITPTLSTAATNNTQGVASGRTYSKRNRMIRKTSSNGSRARALRKQSSNGSGSTPRLPSFLMRAIAEKTTEESEASDRSAEIRVGGSTNQSSHRASADLDLNVIPETGHSTDGGDSFKSADMFEGSDTGSDQIALEPDGRDSIAAESDENESNKVVERAPPRE